MSAKILNGREAADALLAPLKAKIAKLDPKLTIVQVGEDPASSSYIKQKFKSCEAVGLRHEHRHLKDSTTLPELMNVVTELNEDPDVTGFIVQLPLPKHLEAHVPDIIKAIDPKKDVDGFGAYNLGKVFLSVAFEHLPPATPSGVIALLEHFKISIEGKHAVVIGRSNHVGKPLAIMLLNRSATVTVCHSRTKNIAELARQADLLCVAVGKPRFVTKEYVKPGAVVVDIGMSRDSEGKLAGDVDVDSVKDIASWITPVPGGVGPMTVASLIRNCVRAKERQENEKK